MKAGTSGLKKLERQSGILRLLYHLLEGESYFTKILGDYDIPNNQLVRSISELKELGLITQRIDNSSYPPKNMISLTPKGKKVAELLKKIEEVLEG